MKFLKELIGDLTAVFSIKQWKETFTTTKSINKKSFARTLRLLIPQLVLYYILFSPAVAMPLYDSMLFHPTRTGPFDAKRLAGVPIENVQIKSKNGETIHCWYLKNPGSNKIVFISHGNGGNLTTRAELMAMLLKLGVSVFIYDYQGYGKSSGSPNLVKIKEDGDAALNYLLKDKIYKEEQIYLCGESLGSGVTCELSTSIKSGGIILLSPYYSIIKLAKQKLILLNIYPDFCFTIPPYNNALILSLPHAPLLILHGEKDRLIPPSNSQKLFADASVPKQLVWLKNSGHNDILDRDYDTCENALKAFLR